MSTDDAALLQHTPLFGGMPLETLQRLAEKAVRRSYGRGQIIFREEDDGDALCVVVSGLVKVYRTSPDGDEMLLVTLGPAAVFGELPMVDGGPRSASAAAVEATTVMTVNRAALLAALRDSPELAERLLRSLGSMVRRLTDQAADLVFLDLNGRVAKLLLRLAEERGSAEGGGRTLDLHLTQSDLANMVGGSRQSVNQVLNTFERLGYLELDGRRIVIRKRELLQRRAGQSD
ncbi:MAG TPA: Crp/Fnr family transcriptional regulator [Candidatus Dormibacteraeota bacterium]